MKIRSITYFCNPRWPVDETVLRRAGEFFAQAKAAYEAAGYEVQTVRLATIPFPKIMSGNGFSRPSHLTAEAVTTLAKEMDRVAGELGVGYISLGPASMDVPESFAAIPDAIAGSENIFFSGIMADKTRGIDLAAVRACAEVIVRCGPIDPNGFANLRFAALANVPAGAPFFPAAHHDRDEPAFAIATEAADLAVEAFRGQKTMGDGRKTLVAEIEKHGKKIAALSNQLAHTNACSFAGIDFSLAPFPDDAHSLGGAVEGMGIPKIGLHGSLAAAALLTEAVDRADFPHTGFSGFMQPVLEDSVLAARAAEGTLTIKDLLLYSTVCGTGLDTVPLPGDTSSEQIAALLLDLSALALRLDKPLTARLMPVPGKKAGDPTSFDFGFFANSRVMALDALPLHSPLGTAGNLHIQKR